MPVLHPFAPDWIADIVYPLLAGVCALTCVLALGWHYLPPRPRHPLNLVVAVIAFALVWPAVLAAAATGQTPTLSLVGVRAWLRLTWLVVALIFGVPIGYYVKLYWRALMAYRRAAQKSCWRLEA